MTVYYQGTTASLTVQWYEFAGGPPANVTAQTVTIVRVSDAAVVVGPTGIGITQLATGLYVYPWAIAGAEIPGDYAVVWNATDAQLDAVQTSEVVTVQLAPIGGEPCGWALTVDPDCCPGWEGLTAQQRQRGVTYATKILWAATGRRYGLCEVTVRPCGNDRRCGECGGGPLGGGWMRPYILDGLWRNCGCGCPCDCRPGCQITLPGPVADVTEVLIDGVVVAASSYRVDDGQYLVRTDGECWPRCQDYDVDVPAVGTLQVTYLRGSPIPQDVLDAAATLACEFAKSCAGVACRLPGRMSNLTRQGVTVTFTDIDLLLRRGLTGLPEVDQVIVAENPYGLKARPFFYSYDTSPRLRTVTG